MDVLVPMVIGGLVGGLAGRARERRKNRKSKSRDDRLETYSSSKPSTEISRIPGQPYSYDTWYPEGATPGTYRTLEQPYGYGTRYPESLFPNYEAYPGWQWSRGNNTSPVDYPFPPALGPLVNEYRLPHCRTCHHEHPLTAPCLNNYDPFQSSPRSKWQWCSICSRTYDRTSTRPPVPSCKSPGCTTPIEYMHFSSPYDNTGFSRDYCAQHMKLDKLPRFSNRGLITGGPTAQPYLLIEGGDTT